MSACISSSFTVGNPRISPNSLCLKKTSLMAVSSSFRFHSCIPPQSNKLFFFGGRLSLAFRPKSTNRSAFSVAASHQDSKPLESQDSEEYHDTPIQGNELEDQWNQTLASVKEQALKIQSVSQEAYEKFSERAIVILKETSRELNVQAEKAKGDLSVIAEGVTKEGKEYLSTAADKSPEPVKDIVQTFASSTDELKEVSQVRDFFVGIPYGIILSFGGFLSFMMTGSISAIRFGVILGGALLALSISSLRSWKRGESSPMALCGQTAIASIFLVRDIRSYAISSISSHLSVLVSGAMVGFYIYRIILETRK